MHYSHKTLEKALVNERIWTFPHSWALLELILLKSELNKRSLLRRPSHMCSCSLSLKKKKERNWAWFSRILSVHFYFLLLLEFLFALVNLQFINELINTIFFPSLLYINRGIVKDLFVRDVTNSFYWKKKKKRRIKKFFFFL